MATVQAAVGEFSHRDGSPLCLGVGGQPVEPVELICGMGLASSRLLGCQRNTAFVGWKRRAGDGHLLYVLRLVFGSAMVACLVLGFTAFRRRGIAVTAPG